MLLSLNISLQDTLMLKTVHFETNIVLFIHTQFRRTGKKLVLLSVNAAQIACYVSFGNFILKNAPGS